MPVKRRGIQLASADVVTQFPVPPVPVPETRQAYVDLLYLDARLQVRAQGLDADHLSSLVEAYLSGHPVPPVHVFSDPVESVETLWVVDGHHRVHAARTAGIQELPVIVHQGTFRDAIQYTLGANSSHGLRRSRQDLSRAFQTLVRHEFCASTDVKRVAEILGCSDRWARELTQEARDRADMERDATIQRLAAEGRTQCEIADQVGVSQKTVSRALESKRKSSEMTKPCSESDFSLDQQASKSSEPSLSAAVRDRQIEMFGERREDPLAIKAAVDQLAVLRHTLSVFDGGPPAFRVVTVMDPRDRAAYTRLVNALTEQLDIVRAALEVVSRESPA